MNRELARSVLTLCLASILLAMTTIIVSIVVDRHLSLDPTLFASGPSESEEQQKKTKTLEQILRETAVRALGREPGEDLKFPIEIEEAMLQEGLSSIPNTDLQPPVHPHEQAEPNAIE